MEQYCRAGGNIALFESAPPLAEVVLEDISKKVKRIVYAEALRAGACWWHSDGRPGRRGFTRDQISNFVVLATRTPKPAHIRELALDQLTWDSQFMGVYNGDKPEPATITLPPITAKGAEVMRQQLDENLRQSCDTPHMRPADDAFVSVFEPQNQDYWARLNTAGRVKFSEALMLRYADAKIDIAIDRKTNRIRVGEADHGKMLSARGYVYARRLVPHVDFRHGPSVMIYLYESPDGYLYGNLALTEASDGNDVEG